MTGVDRSQRTDVHPCPECGMRSDAVTGIAGARDPGDGDWSICVYCLTPAVFVSVFGKLATRLPTAEETEQARATDPKLAQLLDTVAKVRA